MFHRFHAALQAIALLLLTIGFSGLAPAAFAAGGVEVRGTVAFKSNGKPIHGAEVFLVQLSRAAVTDEAGNYSF
ncbi:MAG: carboxypeptidase-like regulatory domain-containing protein, partial [Acidobacteriota bacterium]|nr:carboxypeptidase-like regulatory domain-containing protein [Acidobacteriota bacterium]